MAKTPPSTKPAPKRALYAFTGDPITYGHIDIVERAARQFDEVVVGIGVNVGKTPMFSLDERLALATHALEGIPNAVVRTFDGMLVDFCYEQGISVVVKGVRNSNDFVYENDLHRAGDREKLGIETFPLFANPDLSAVSSSMVKAVQQAQGTLDSYVPIEVKRALEARVSGQYIVGVTGEMGSGKSYVSKALERLAKARGIPSSIIGLDEIGHSIHMTRTEPVYQALRDKLAAEFGSSVQNPDGTINRKALRDVVFNDDAKLARLNDLMRTPMSVRTRRELSSRKGLIFYDAALIAEFGLSHVSNNDVVLVGVDPALQYERLSTRNGLTHEEVDHRLGMQKRLPQKRETIEAMIAHDKSGRIFEVQSGPGDTDEALGKVLDSIIKYTDQYGELRFYGMWKDLGCDGDPRPVYHQIRNAYSAAPRRYHTWRHVMEMLDGLETVKDKVERPAELAFAIMTHDGVMDYLSKINEEASAHMGSAILRKALVADPVLKRIEKLTLATKHGAVPTENDETIMAALDLLILGMPHARYAEYAQGIRSEFSHIPWPDYCEGRTKVMTPFMERAKQGTLYLVPEFKDYEARAYENISWELSTLKSK